MDEKSFHPSVKRLLEFVRTHSRKSTTWPELASSLGASAAGRNAWEKRGLSKEAALKAARLNARAFLRLLFNTVLTVSLTLR